MSLTDGIAGSLTIAGQQLGVVTLHNLIGGMCHGQVCPQTHLVVEHLVETHLNLITVGLYLTEVHHGWALTKVRRNELRVAYQHVYTLVAENLDSTGKQTTKQAIVDTHIELLHGLPVYVGVTNG